MSKAPLYPQGSLVGQIVKHGFTESQNRNLVFFIDFKILGVPDPEDPSTYQEFPETNQRIKTVRQTLTDNPKTYEMLEDMILRLGWNSFEDLSELDPGQDGEDHAGEIHDLWNTHHPEWGDQIQVSNGGFQRPAVEKSAIQLANERLRAARQAAQAALKSATKPVAAAAPKSASGSVSRQAVRTPQAKGKYDPYAHVPNHAVQPNGDLVGTAITDDDVPY
jgi:hypothetical protein